MNPCFPARRLAPVRYLARLAPCVRYVLDDMHAAVCATSCSVDTQTHILHTLAATTYPKDPSPSLFTTSYLAGTSVTQFPVSATPTLTQQLNPETRNPKHFDQPKYTAHMSERLLCLHSLPALFTRHLLQDQGGRTRLMCPDWFITSVTCAGLPTWTTQWHWDPRSK